MSRWPLNSTSLHLVRLASPSPANNRPRIAIPQNLRMRPSACRMPGFRRSSRWRSSLFRKNTCPPRAQRRSNSRPSRRNQRSTHRPNSRNRACHIRRPSRRRSKTRPSKIHLRHVRLPPSLLRWHLFPPQVRPLSIDCSWREALQTARPPSICCRSRLFPLRALPQTNSFPPNSFRHPVRIAWHSRPAATRSPSPRSRRVPPLAPRFPFPNSPSDNPPARRVRRLS